MAKQGKLTDNCQFLKLFKKVWDEVDRLFDAPKVLTPRGHALVQTYAIKGAHPELPYALNFLTMMAALSNGARARLFPNADSPLFLVFVNVNYAQVRKSSITGLNDGIGELLEKVIQERIQVLLGTRRS